MLIIDEIPRVLLKNLENEQAIPSIKEGDTASVCRLLNFLIVNGLVMVLLKPERKKRKKKNKKVKKVDEKKKLKEDKSAEEKANIGDKEEPLAKSGKSSDEDAKNKDSQKENVGSVQLSLANISYSIL